MNLHLQKKQYMQKSFINIGVAGILLLCVGCSGGNTVKQKETVVKTDTVKVSGVAEALEFPAKVKAAEKVNLAFKVSGTLQNVFYKEGEYVKKGMPVAALDSRDYELLLQATEAEYKNIKADAERIIAMYADSAVSASAYDKARYGLQQIESKYKNAVNQLADTKLYAPFNAYIESVIFEPQSVVGAGMPVVTVISADKEEIEINIPASVYMKRGDIESFTACFDYLSGEPMPLSLVSMSKNANSNQLYTVRLQISGSVKERPSVGMNGVVNLLFKNSGSCDVQISSSALFQKNGESRVWLCTPSGTVKQRSVKVKSLHTDGMAVISEGLSEGDVVVSAGVNNLVEGQSVRRAEGSTATNVGGLL